MSDIINVKTDFNAVGDNSHDDTPNLQAAFDAAFGSSASPHGSASSTLNRPVRIPSGTYKTTSSLNLTRVVGGRIYGDGAGATTIAPQFSDGTPCIAINGAAHFAMELLQINGTGVAGSFGIDLNWDNAAGGDGLHHNRFSDILLAGAKTAMIIAGHGFGGNNNLFQHMTFGDANCTLGLEARGSGAVDNVVLLSGGTGLPAFYCSGGSMHFIAPPFHNDAAGYDIQVDSGLLVTVTGGRTETPKFLKLNHGIVTVRGLQQLGASVELANVKGGRLNLAGVRGDSSIINGAVATASLSSISGATLTLGGTQAGTPQIGQVVSGSGIPTGTLAPHIISGSGTTWTLNYSPGNVTNVAVTLGSMLYMYCSLSVATAGTYNGTIVQNI